MGEAFYKALPLTTQYQCFSCTTNQRIHVVHAACGNLCVMFMCVCGACLRVTQYQQAVIHWWKALARTQTCACLGECFPSVLSPLSTVHVCWVGMVSHNTCFRQGVLRDWTSVGDDKYLGKHSSYISQNKFYGILIFSAIPRNTLLISCTYSMRQINYRSDCKTTLFMEA